MPSKQGDSRSEIKKLCIYSLLCAVCIIMGYIESLLNLSFIVPGMKLGLSNSIACVLILSGDVKGAFAVNISRILLSALLFGSPVSLCFSLAGGILSLLVMVLLKKSPHFSFLGVSSVGGVTHNVVQCGVGVFFVGVGVIYYLPVLLLSGLVCGAAVGALAKLTFKRIKRG